MLLLTVMEFIVNCVTPKGRHKLKCGGVCNGDASDFGVDEAVS